MVTTLVFSITAAGLLFLALGERLGLPAPAGLVALQALLALACGLLILLSATNRIMPFLAEAPRSQGFGRVARMTILLLVAIAASGGLALEEPARVGILLAGFVAGTILLLPCEAGFAQPESLALRAGGVLRGLAVAGLALAILLSWLPQVLLGLAEALQREPQTLRGGFIAMIALAVAIGGATGLSRLARALLLLGLVFALLPLALGGALDRGLPMELMRGTGMAMLNALSPALHAGGLHQALPDLLAGFAIGGLGSALRPAQEKAGQSLLVAALALVLALGSALLIMAQVVGLHGIVIGEIAGQPPERWPLFVFDEAIRGWLNVCGEAPRDVLDAFRACRARGVAGSFPPSEFRLDPALIGPAIAASHGVPLVLGAGWMLAGPLAGLVACGLLLHGAAVLVSETLLFRRNRGKTLRSTRLLLARGLVFLPMAALLLLPENARLEPRLTLWLMLGAALLILMAQVADMLRAGMRLWQAHDNRLPAISPAEAAS
jgi:hypothetical protein